MFENAGAKIQTIAKVFFWTGGVVGTIAQIVSLAFIEDLEIKFLPLVIIGLLISIFLLWLFQWIACLFIYAFGELVEDTSDIADYSFVISKPFRPQSIKTKTQATPVTKVNLSPLDETPDANGIFLGKDIMLVTDDSSDDT